MTKRARILSFGCAGLLVLAGVAGAVAFGGGTGQILALVLISLGCVLATALVFLEVGLSEDRERAREAQAAREREEREHARKPRSERVPGPPGEGRGSRRLRPRLDRRRGRPRRLG
ncbi:MAG: hypothetical protein JO039_21880 [Solirubrobacterales bacterium]|nr:hypothetical protein [Solirubrobacterales bacterium]